MTVYHRATDQLGETHGGFPIGDADLAWDDGITTDEEEQLKLNEKYIIMKFSIKFVDQERAYGLSCQGVMGYF